MLISEMNKAHDRIKPYIHRTRVLTSESLNKMTSANLYFKSENFQKSGSFKIRGATNAVLQLSSKILKGDIVPVSSGNHGAALSMAVSRRNGSTIVVMPKNTSKIKVNNVIRNGGRIVWCGPSNQSRERALTKLKTMGDVEVIHPYDNKHVILGQSTIGKEFIEDIPNLDAIVVPVSGGGLLSGVLSYVKKINPSIKIFGAEPSEADDTFRSIQSGKIETNITTNTVCDGLRAQIGSITFPIIQELVDGIIVVSENDIIKSLKLILNRLKIIVEPSCSIALAAVISNKSNFKNKNIGIVLTGGNIDINQLPW